MSNVIEGFDSELRKETLKKRIAVIPIGSIEQHGAHLPVSTDADLAQEISRRQKNKISSFTSDLAFHMSMLELFKPLDRLVHPSIL